MIKQYLGRFKSAIASDAALPWFYGVYAVVFLLYSVARVWNYIDYTENTDPVWLTEASPSARYILQVIPVACLLFFALATLLIRAKSQFREALGRAHCRYMLQTVWLVVGFWLVELFLYWTPLALISWLFAMPLRLVCTGFYVLAFARSVWGLRQFSRGEYPSPKDVPMHKTRGMKCLLWSFPGFLLLNWFVISGSWYVQDYFSKPGNTHTITIAMQGDAAKSTPYKMRLVYVMKDPRPGCLSYSPFTGKWSGPAEASMWVRAPDAVTEHEQIFHYSLNEVGPGYCGWQLGYVQIINGAFLARETKKPEFNSLFIGGLKFFHIGFPHMAFVPAENAKSYALGKKEVVYKRRDQIVSREILESPTDLRFEYLFLKDDPICLHPLSVYECPK